MASLIDICTLVCTFAPIAVLLSNTGRSGMAFRNIGVCRSWTIFFNFATRFSLFIVMVMSISRTIAIKAPFLILKQSLIIYISILYAIWILGKDVIFIATSANVRYSPDFATCVYSYTGVLGKVFSTFFLIEIFLVLMVIVICFLLCMTSLSKQQKDPAKFRRVSVTITIFTAVCLMCNLPFIIILIMQLSGVLGDFDLRVKYNIRFLCYTFFMVLNAALNPCVYMARMPQYRKWLFTKSSTKTSSSSQKYES